MAAQLVALAAKRLAPKIISAVAVASVLMMSLFIALIGGSSDSPVAQAEPACTTSGPVTGLSAAQAKHTRDIVGEASAYAGSKHEDPVHAALIALMTADVESGFHVWASLSDPPSLQDPQSDGPSSTNGGYGDHGSLGLFQQQTQEASMNNPYGSSTANWGTHTQVMDPKTSTDLFLARLFAVTNWSTMDAGTAAQKVQGSAYPDRYAAKQSEAQGILTQIESGTPGAASPGTATPAAATTLTAGVNPAPAAPPSGNSAATPAASMSQCGAAPGAVANIAPGSHGLPVDYKVPVTANANEQAVVTYALAQLDKPYVWGAAGPTAFDCSGLTQTAWGRAGVKLSHYTGTQLTAGTAVASEADSAPGDLILIPGSDGSLAAPGHVGMYIGNGLIVSAMDEHDGINVQTWAAFTGGGLSGIRHVG